MWTSTGFFDCVAPAAPAQLHSEYLLCRLQLELLATFRKGLRAGIICAIVVARFIS
jgi:hypothetical protein